MSEKFNLDRELNIRESVDPRGVKWNIMHIRGTALYEARPHNNKSDIPDEFIGRWTKPDLLKQQIDLYLNRAWDKAEEEAKRAPANKRAADKRKQTTKAKQKTAKESLDELSDDVKKELGDVIATKDEE